MVMCIKARRLAADMSQEELATRMGVTRTAVTNWESEVTLPRARQLPDLADILGVGIQDLFVLTETSCGPHNHNTVAEGI